MITMPWSANIKPSTFGPSQTSKAFARARLFFLSLINLNVFKKYLSSSEIKLFLFSRALWYSKGLIRLAHISSMDSDKACAIDAPNGGEIIFLLAKGIFSTLELGSSDLKEKSCNHWNSQIYQSFNISLRVRIRF